jgi:hypothetical protein
MPPSFFAVSQFLVTPVSHNPLARTNTFFLPIQVFLQYSSFVTPALAGNNNHLPHFGAFILRKQKNSHKNSFTVPQEK